MLEWILVLLYVTFALAATAAGWSLAARHSSGVGRRVLIVLVALALLVPTLDFAWMGLSMHFGVGIGHAPWLLAIVALVAHGGGLLALRRRANAAAGWPLATLCTLAGVSLALDATVLWNLDLRARLQVSELRFEAGRMAYELLREEVDGAENAAPVYTRVGAALFDGEDSVSLTTWSNPMMAGERYDAQDPELLAALARCAPGLAEVRAASRLPLCRFGAGPMNLWAPDAEAPWNDGHVLHVIGLSQGLGLEGSSRARGGDLDGALENVEALLAMSEQVLQTPLLFHLIIAGLQRSLASRLLAEVLSAPGLRAEQLERLTAALPPAVMPRAGDALAMEQAWGLSVLGQFSEAGFGELGEFELPGYSPTQKAVMSAFFVTPEIAGYRAAMAEQIALASGSLAELQAENARPDAELRELAARRGLMAVLVVGKFARVLIGVQRADAQVELARAALAAAAVQLESGAYPASPGELGLQGVRIELDGSVLTLTDSDPAWGGDAPSLRIGAVR